MPGPPRSVRAQLTIWYSVMLCIPLVAFAVVSYLTFSRTLTGRTDGFLHEALTVFANELRVERRQLQSLEEAFRTTVREVRFRDLDIVVLDEQGELLAESPPAAGGAASTVTGRPPPLSGIRAALPRPSNAPDELVSTLPGPEGGFRMSAHRLELDGRWFSVVGVYPLAEVEHTLRRIRHLFLIAIPLLLLLAATGGWFLARRSFRPVSAMATRAREISARTLHERLPVITDDELGDLARVLNDLLDRLETSFEQQRRFVADASHELRSPTAILRTETDITLAKEHRSEEEYRESLAIVQGAANRLTRVVDDLFLLARVDGGHPVMNVAPLYLDDVVQDTVHVVRPLAERKGVRLDVVGSLDEPFQGDPDLLGRLFLNLIDNAIKHSPEGGRVEVRLTRRDAFVEVAVVDSGPGIPLEAHSRVFERFYQVDSSRTRNDGTLTSGAGLGLAIGLRIAEMHHGRLDLTGSGPGRTVFLLSLPVGGVPGPEGRESPFKPETSP